MIFKELRDEGSLRVPDIALKVHSKPDREGESCVIVHAPTRPGPKGSDQIQNAVDSLRAKGLSIEFIKLIERPNSDVLSAISRCDFVVDELFSDTAMASLASEAAVLGKPAIVGMYGYETLQKFTEPCMIPPALVCQPGEIEASIEKLVLDKEFRLALGLKASPQISYGGVGTNITANFCGRFIDSPPLFPL